MIPAFLEPRHAMAFVRWDVFRPGKNQELRAYGEGQRIFDYAGPKQRLVEVIRMVEHCGW
jgi:hypothetical protein